MLTWFPRTYRRPTLRWVCISHLNSKYFPFPLFTWHAFSPFFGMYVILSNWISHLHHGIKHLLIVFMTEFVWVWLLKPLFNNKASSDYNICPDFCLKSDFHDNINIPVYKASWTQFISWFGNDTPPWPNTRIIIFSGHRPVYVKFFSLNDALLQIFPQ